MEFAPYKVKQVIVVRKDLNMRKGKMCAQVAHASMKWIFDNNEGATLSELLVKLSEAEQIWTHEAFAKIVVSVDSEGELQDLILKAKVLGVDAYPIIDQGRTEFNGVPTLTCVAFGPDFEENLDKVTGHLKLL